MKRGIYKMAISWEWLYAHPGTVVINRAGSAFWVENKGANCYRAKTDPAFPKHARPTISEAMELGAANGFDTYPRTVAFLVVPPLPIIKHLSVFGDEV